MDRMAGLHPVQPALCPYPVCIRSENDLSGKTFHWELIPWPPDHRPRSRRVPPLVYYIRVPGQGLPRDHPPPGFDNWASLYLDGINCRCRHPMGPPGNARRCHRLCPSHRGRRNRRGLDRSHRSCGHSPPCRFRAGGHHHPLQYPRNVRFARTGSIREGIRFLRHHRHDPGDRVGDPYIIALIVLFVTGIISPSWLLSCRLFPFVGWVIQLVLTRSSRFSPPGMSPGFMTRVPHRLRQPAPAP